MKQLAPAGHAPQDRQFAAAKTNSRSRNRLLIPAAIVALIVAGATTWFLLNRSSEPLVPAPTTGGTALFSWGWGGHGLLGDGSSGQEGQPGHFSAEPLAVDTSGPLAGATIITIATNWQHALAVTIDGQVVAWGNGKHGRLGTGTEADQSTPTAVAADFGDKTIWQVAAGGAHSLALATDGTAYAWGRGNYGQLGAGGTKSALAPVEIKALRGNDTVQVAAGADYSLALGQDGAVYAWGSGQYGQLGIEGKVGSSSIRPLAVPDLADKSIVQVAAGFEHALALSADGVVYAWGNNTNGQVGADPQREKNVPTPRPVAGLAGIRIVQIAAGSAHSLALAADGTLYAWGAGQSGQLGDGHPFYLEDAEPYFSATPVTVSTAALPGKTITAIVAADSRSLALTSDGAVYAWGDGTFGDLGDGQTDSSAVPVAVTMSGALAGKSVIQIADGLVLTR